MRGHHPTYLEYTLEMLDGVGSYAWSYCGIWGEGRKDPVMLSKCRYWDGFHQASLLGYQFAGEIGRESSGVRPLGIY